MGIAVAVARGAPDARPRIDHHEVFLATGVEPIDGDADRVLDAVVEEAGALRARRGMQLLEVGRDHRAAIAAAAADPLEQRGGRHRDATPLEPVAELGERADATVEPALDLVERAALARGVELVEQLLLDSGRVGAGAVGDPAQQVRR